MKLKYPTGATPLDQNEIEGLLLPLRTQKELNDAEHEAIADGRSWAQKSRNAKNELLTVTGLRRLHKEMFSPVWSWAGTFRKTEKNIGVAPHQIQIMLNELAQNTEYQARSISDKNWQRLAAEFHHGLVRIHPFSNGNGRHGRLATDILGWRLKMPEPSWGDPELARDSRRRKSYIDALKMADWGDIDPLIEFMFF